MLFFFCGRKVCLCWDTWQLIHLTTLTGKRSLILKYMLGANELFPMENVRKPLGKIYSSGLRTYWTWSGKGTQEEESMTFEFSMSGFIPRNLTINRMEVHIKALLKRAWTTFHQRGEMRRGNCTASTMVENWWYQWDKNFVKIIVHLCADVNALRNHRWNPRIFDLN